MGCKARKTNKQTNPHLTFKINELNFMKIVYRHLDRLPFLCRPEKYFWPVIDKIIPNKTCGLLLLVVAIYWSHYD